MSEYVSISSIIAAVNDIVASDDGIKRLYHGSEEINYGCVFSVVDSVAQYEVSLNRGNFLYDVQMQDGARVIIFAEPADVDIVNIKFSVSGFIDVSEAVGTVNTEAIDGHRLAVRFVDGVLAVECHPLETKPAEPEKNVAPARNKATPNEFRRSEFA